LARRSSIASPQSALVPFACTKSTSSSAQLHFRPSASPKFTCIQHPRRHLERTEVRVCIEFCFESLSGHNSPRDASAEGSHRARTFTHSRSRASVWYLLLARHVQVGTWVVPHVLSSHTPPPPHLLKTRASSHFDTLLPSRPKTLSTLQLPDQWYSRSLATDLCREQPILILQRTRLALPPRLRWPVIPSNALQLTASFSPA
jgi:hypothetical protein